MLLRLSIACVVIGYLCLQYAAQIGAQEEGCPTNEFYCPEPSGSAPFSCLPSSWRCDGAVDCEDNGKGLDEIDCPPVNCSSKKFNCGHSCIDSNWQCDHEDDCAFGEDEVNCTTSSPEDTCTDNEFFCSIENDCIPLDWRCDGEPDCVGDEDERECPTKGPDSACETNEFQCTKGNCVDIEWLCDNYDDCGDLSDEPPSCNSTCAQGELQCPHSEGVVICIEPDWLCDGDPDCPEAWDENRSTHNCTTLSCNEFSCETSGECYSLSWVCDGAEDCADGSDEAHPNCTKPGASQELTLTPSSSTACLGDVVTLVCQHPELANNTQTNRYMSALSWRENGRSVQTAPGTTYQATTTADFTSTTLTITISSDYFSGGFFYYDCFLLLSAGGLDTSGNSTLAVSELSSPILTSTSSLESSITVEWLAANCAHFYNIYWQCTEPGSNGSISTTNTNIIIPVNGSTECTLRVVAIDAEGSAGPNTAAAVYPGFPRPANASSSTLSCTNRSLLLTCQFGGGEYTDIQWTSSRGPVDSSGGSLTINDASTLQQGTEFWCSGVPVGGTATFRVTGESYVYSESLTCEPLITPPSSGGDSAAAVAGGSIGGVLVVGIVFIAGCVSGVLAQVLYRKVTAKKSAAPPFSSPAPSYGHTQGDVGAGPEMTDNPSYQLVERIQDSRQLYQNI